MMDRSSYKSPGYTAVKTCCCVQCISSTTCLSIHPTTLSRTGKI